MRSHANAFVEARSGSRLTHDLTLRRWSRRDGKSWRASGAACSLKGNPFLTGTKYGTATLAGCLRGLVAGLRGERLRLPLRLPGRGLARGPGPAASLRVGEFYRAARLETFRHGRELASRIFPTF